jgi:hypothetical protein
MNSVPLTPFPPAFPGVAMIMFGFFLQAAFSILFSFVGAWLALRLTRR